MPLRHALQAAAAAALLSRAAATTPRARDVSHLVPQRTSLWTSLQHAFRDAGSDDALVGQSAPAFPDACNITYDSQQGFEGANDFLDANSQCYSDFATCMQAGPGNCQRSCTADIDVLQAACDTTYCVVAGSVTSPQNPLVPSFDFRTAACYPDGCDDSTNAEVAAWWRYQLCGSALWAGPDCAAITVSCAYDLSAATIWIIVGSVLGFFLLCGTGLFTWWWCERRKHDADDAAAEDAYYDEVGDEEAALMTDTTATATAHLAPAVYLPRADVGDPAAASTPVASSGYDPAWSAAGHAAPVPQVGYTYADLSRRPGAAQDAILSTGDDRL